MTMEEILFGIEKLEAVKELKKLMASYMDGRNWVHSKSASCDLPWGAYDGFEGFLKCYRTDHGYCMDDEGNPLPDPEDEEPVLGLLCPHTYSTPVIEVAEDGQTARGVWFSPGSENFGLGDNISDDRDRGIRSWGWTKYAFDFKKVEGVWKVWHYELFAVFLTPFETCWTHVRPYDGNSGITTTQDRPPIKEPYDWSIDTVYPYNHPYPPEPYRTWDDVHPGYGYLEEDGSLVERVIENHTFVQDRKRVD